MLVSLNEWTPTQTIPNWSNPPNWYGITEWFWKILDMRQMYICFSKNRVTPKSWRTWRYQLCWNLRHQDNSVAGSFCIEILPGPGVSGACIGHPYHWQAGEPILCCLQEGLKLRLTMFDQIYDMIYSRINASTKSTWRGAKVQKHKSCVSNCSAFYPFSKLFVIFVRHLYHHRPLTSWNHSLDIQTPPLVSDVWSHRKTNPKHPTSGGMWRSLDI